MDISPSGLVRNWLPQLPHVLKTAALSTIGRSPNSQYQDTLTETIVASARPILQTPGPLLQSQQNCKADWGVGRPWISKYTIPKPADEEFIAKSDSSGSRNMTLTSAVDFAIDVLCRPEHVKSILDRCTPDLVDVETEWTFYRPHTLPISPIPDISEQQLYTNYMRDVDVDGPTILHLHGGAYCLMDPSTHRWTLSSLAQHSAGRVLSVRYRLSPQNVFPAALMDAFQAYLALISPPANAYHLAIPPAQIVLSGDSSGGGLASSLMLLLLTLSTHNISIAFHGKTVTMPSPPCAGLALASPWLDLTRSLPSTVHNCRYDILAPPPLDAASPPFPTDAIWPSSPPRAETFTIANMVTHPLVSPLAASSKQWKGIPPVYMSCGWEGFTDEVEVYARRIYQSSAEATVVFEGWEGMPHCFMMVPWNRAGREALQHWGAFCNNATRSDSVQRVDSGSWTSSLTYASRSVKLNDLGMTLQGSGYVREAPLDDATVATLMEKGRAWRVGLEDNMIRKWKEGLSMQSPVS